MLHDKVGKYFPIIRERDEILKIIADNPRLQERFNDWSSEQQEEFLDFNSGVKGVKMLYDSFFKEIMNPEYTLERLNSLLSLLIGEEGTISGCLCYVFEYGKGDEYVF